MSEKRRPRISTMRSGAKAYLGNHPGLRDCFFVWPRVGGVGLSVAKTDDCTGTWTPGLIKGMFGT